MISPRRLALISLALAIPLLALGTAYLTYRTRTALEDSAAELRASREAAVSLKPLQPQLAAVEWIGSPAEFRGVAVFAGRFYVAARSGVFEYESDGTLRSRLRVGLELPSAPPTALAVGVAPRGSGNNTGESLLVATAGEGLLIFDGSQWVQLRSEAADWRDLTSVLPMRDGRVLLGTEKAGVLQWDGERLERWNAGLQGEEGRLLASRDAAHVTALAGDGDELWIGTHNAGALRWSGGRLQVLDATDGLPDLHVSAINAAADKTYIGTAQGVAEVESGKVTRVLAEQAIVRSLLVENEVLTIGTFDQGVLEMPLASSRTIRGSVKQANQEIATVERLLHVDGQKLALTKDALYVLDRNGRGSEVIRKEHSLLADGNVSALSFDQQGRLWVGYFDRGLDIVEMGRGSAPAIAKHAENETLFCVNRIITRPDGTTAVATANGLAMFDDAGKLRQVLHKSDGLIGEHVTDVLAMGDDMVIATTAGITFLDVRGPRSLYAFHGMVSNHAYTLAASDGKILVGTLGGATVLQDGVVRANFTTANSGLKANWITAALRLNENDRSGWLVGTYGKGLLRMNDAGDWESFEDLPADLEINPNAMLRTRDRVYAGSLRHGLFFYDIRSQRWTNMTTGLPSRSVTAFAFRDGYLYVGTDNGLVRMREPQVGGAQ